MAKETVADYLLNRLREWDVQHIFAYPGDGINAILAAFGRAENKPKFIQARHEEMAAFEAVGYSKFTGRVGVCMATSGPGAIHLLNGLYDAKLDHVPVVAIVGQTSRSAMGGSSKPTVLDVLVDPDVPALPPHATLAQAEALAGALLLKGDPDAIGIVTESLKTKIQEFLPHREKR